MNNTLIQNAVGLVCTEPKEFGESGMSFRIAVSLYCRDTSPDSDEEHGYETKFMTVKSFGRITKMAKGIKKGVMVAVSGDTSYNKWEKGMDEVITACAISVGGPPKGKKAKGGGDDENDDLPF